MDLASGDLREIIRIEALTPGVPNGQGGFASAWVTIPRGHSVYAKVIAKAGTEVVISGRLSAVATTLFIIRNRTDLSENMRIVWRGRAMNIRNIRREGFGPSFLTIEAEGGVAT